MSFKTVICPKCNASQIEFIKPDEIVTCNSCKKAFSPFKSVDTKPIEPSNIRKQSTADKLVASIQLITKLLETYLEDSEHPTAKDHAIKVIKLEMPKLLAIITDSLKIDRHDLSTAFQTSIKYSPLSEEPQRLDIVLTYLYFGLRHLERMTSFGLFDDRNHEVFAQSLVTKHGIAIDKIVNS